jgi:hypothetical protein
MYVYSHYINQGDAVMKLYTTLNLLREAGVLDGDAYDDVEAYLGPDYDKDAPIDLLTILEYNGVNPCLRSLGATTEPNTVALGFAIACARRALPVFETAYPDDNLPRKAIEAAEGFIAGICTAADAHDAAAAAGTSAVRVYSVHPRAARAAYAASYAASYAGNDYYNDPVRAASYAVRASGNYKLEHEYQAQLLRLLLS